MSARLQIFGLKKCVDTRKAERYFKERRIEFQRIELSEKGLSAGELRAVAARTGLPALLDREGARFRDLGLAHSALSDKQLEEKLLADPLLLRTPIVRKGPLATVGYVPDVWSTWEH